MSNQARHSTGLDTRKQRGVALLMVLLIVALATGIAANMLARHHRSVLTTRQVVYSDQALEYALGAEALVRQRLYSDWNQDEQRPRVDGLGDAWAIGSSTGASTAAASAGGGSANVLDTEDRGGAGQLFELERGALEIRVTDLQGRFNLNTVDGEQGYRRFQRLLTQMGGEPAYAEALRDWYDEDREARPRGAEDGRYLTAKPPYRAANRPLAAVSELRLLAEMDDALSKRLTPLVAALPAAVETLNVNTASPRVLRLYAADLDRTRAASLARPREPWKTVDAFVADAPAFQTTAEALGVASSFFEMRVRARYAGYTVTMRSVIYRDPRTGHTRVLARDLGQPVQPLREEASSEDV